MKLTNRGYKAVKKLEADGVITPLYMDGKILYTEENVNILNNEQSKDDRIDKLEETVAMLVEFILKVREFKTDTTAQLNTHSELIGKLSKRTTAVESESLVAPNHKQVTITAKPTTETKIETPFSKPIEEMTVLEAKQAKLSVIELLKVKIAEDEATGKEILRQKKKELSQSTKREADVARIKDKHPTIIANKLKRKLQDWHWARYQQMCKAYVPTLEDFTFLKTLYSKVSYELGVNGKFEDNTMEFLENGNELITMLEALDFSKDQLLNHRGKFSHITDKRLPILEELITYAKNSTPYNPQWDKHLYVTNLLAKKFEHLPTITPPAHILELTDDEILGLKLPDEPVDTTDNEANKDTKDASTLSLIHI